MLCTYRCEILKRIGIAVGLAALVLGILDGAVASAQSSDAPGNIAVIFMVDQSEHMGDPAVYCGPPDATSFSDPNELRFYGPQFALNWLGRAYLSHLKQEDVGIWFSTIYFGGYDRAFNVFKESHNFGLVPVHPNTDEEWRTTYEQAITNLAPDAANIYAYNRANGRDECAHNAELRNLNLGNSDPLGAMEELEDTLAGLPRDTRIVLIMLTDGLPNVTAGEEAPPDRVTASTDSAAIQRYILKMTKYLSGLQARFPNLNFHLAPIFDRTLPYGGGVAGFAKYWQALDPEAEPIKDTRIIGVPFQETLNQLLDAYGLEALDIACGEEVTVPPLVDQLQFTIHKPNNEPAFNSQMKLFRNDDLFRVLDEDIIDDTDDDGDGVQVQVNGVATPIQEVLLTGPVGGARWRLQCPQYGTDDSPTRIFVQQFPLTLSLEASGGNPWVGLPTLIEAVGQRATGERVELEPYLGPGARIHLSWSSPGFFPDPQTISGDGVKNPAQFYVMANAAGEYTASISKIEIRGQPIEPEASAPIVLAFMPIQANLAVSPGPNFMFPITVTLHIKYPYGGAVTVDPDWKDLYGVTFNVFDEAGALTEQAILPLATALTSARIGLPRPGAYRVTAHLSANAIDNANLMAAPVTLQAQPWAPAANSLNISDTVVAWLINYTVNFPLLDPAGMPYALPLSESEYDYTAAVQIASVSPSFAYRVPLLLEDGAIRGTLAISVSTATTAITLMPTLVRTERSSGKQTTVDIGPARSVTVVTPTLLLENTSAFPSEGCPSPVAVRSALIVDNEILPPSIINASPYTIAADIHRIVADGIVASEPWPDIAQPWERVECFFDFWNPHTVTYLPVYDVIDRVSGATVGEIQGISLEVHLERPLLSLAYYLARNPADIAKGGSVLAFFCIGGMFLYLNSDLRHKRTPLPAPLKRIQVRLDNRPEMTKFNPECSDRNRKIYFWRPDDMPFGTPFDTIEIRQYWDGDAQDALESNRWWIGITVRDKNGHFEWLKNAPVLKDDETTECTLLRLPGGLLLTARVLNLETSSQGQD